MEIPSPIAPTGAARPRPAIPDAALREAAQSFEATFLAEMLQYTGLNAMPAGFGGGAGEQAFASLLTGQYAERLAARGGIGIAERIFEVLQQRAEDA
jgi:Rod binding domain-containing protein